MVEAALGEKAELSLSTTNEATGGPEAVARLLNTISPEHEHALFEGMRQIDQELAERVRALRLVFEDLVGLDAKGIQRVLREVDGRDLSLSLKAASDDVKVRIRSGLTERAAAALEEEIEMLGPVRVRDVEEAQQRILDTVRALEEAGEIVLRRSGGRDDVIG
jgi:flagellar motor switch protein FliG